MWPKVNLKEVAGSIRKNVSTFANEVAKQAQTLAEEEDFDEDEEEDDEKAARHRPSEVQKAKPGRSPVPSGGSLQNKGPKPQQRQSALSDNGESSPISRPVHDQPVASKIVALRARLEADKAKRLRDLQSGPSPQKQQSPSTANGSSAQDSPLQKIDMEINGGRNLEAQREAAESPAMQLRLAEDGEVKSKTVLMAMQLESNKAEIHKCLDGIPQQEGITGLEEGDSQYDYSPEDRQPIPRWQSAMRSSTGHRSDDFVDIPLNSPALLHAMQASADKHRTPTPSSKGQSQDKDRSTAETEQLKDQLQRLKAQMVSSSMAQEEDNARLQQELAEAVKEKDSLYAERTELYESLRKEQLARTSASKEKQAQLRIVAIENEAEERLRNLEQEHAQKLQAKQEELTHRDQEIEALRKSLNSEKDAHSAQQDLRLQEAQQRLQVAEASAAELRSERQALRESLHSAQHQLHRHQQASQSSSATSQELVLRLEAELAAERDAHETTLRDSEATLVELEGLRGGPGSQNGAILEAEDRVQAELNTEKEARGQAEALGSELQKRLDDAIEHSKDMAFALRESESRWRVSEASLKAERDSSQAELQQLHQSTSQLQSELAQIKERMTKQEADWRAQEDSLQQKLAAAGLGSASAQARIQELESHLEGQSEAERRAEAKAANTAQALEALQRLSSENDRRHRQEMETALEEVKLASAASGQEAMDRLATAKSEAQKEGQLLRQQCHELGVKLRSAELRAQEAANGLETQLTQHRTQNLQLEAELHAAQEENEALQKGLQDSAANSGHAALAAEAQEAQDSLRRQLLGSQATTSRLQAELEHLRSRETGQDSVSADELSGLRAALAAAEAEREKAKQQLSRLKLQMVSDQEAEDDKMHWRVEAEVQSATRAAEAATEAAAAEVAALKQEMRQQQEHAASLETSLAAWEAAVAERDAEIVNLQGALGELTYESEAAERLRTDLRNEKAAKRSLQDQLDKTQEAQKAAESRCQALEAQVEAAQAEAAEQAVREARLLEEANTLRKAVQESVKRIHMMNSDSNAMVDRRIVVKLLVTYFQRKQSPEILDLMSKLLGLSDSDLEAIRGSKQGILKTMTAVPRSLLKRANSSASDQGKDSLADSWVDFLIQQAQAAEAEEKLQSEPTEPAP